jgi:hypothetical protein
MTRPLPRLFALALALAACDGTSSPATPDASADAGADTVWLCRPGLPSNPCALSLDTTVVSADGTTTVERAAPAVEAPIDCFYVYPTISAQGTLNADLSVDPELVTIAEQQAARFSSVCRVFAPVYRQVTVSGLISPTVTAANFDLAYADVRRAWSEYLARDNNGRGVVLVGHSQGAGMLTRLVRERIDGDAAARARIVSALLIGGDVGVPAGGDVGGDFANVPACRALDQTGCVVAYSAFTMTPPTGALFGRVEGAASRALCVNPAMPAGEAAPLRAVFHVRSMESQGVAVRVPVALTTPWVTYPGLFRGACMAADGASWLQITESRATGDTRPALADALGPAWGLHLLDVTLALGDMVELVRQQSARWRR